MSDQETNQAEGQTNQQGSQEQAASAPTEKQVLMERARMMGITFSNNATPEQLRAKIEAKMAGEQEQATQAEQVNPLAAAGSTTQAAAQQAVEAPVVPRTLQQMMHDEYQKLIRVRITNMDPRKANLPGEIFTVANEYLGTVRKFIPYGEASEDGYHIPYALYLNLKEREFLNVRTVKDRKTGVPVVTSSMAKEFAIEVLEPLTEEELKQLATAQIAAGSVE